MSEPVAQDNTNGPLNKQQELMLVNKCANRIRGKASLEDSTIAANCKDIDDIVGVLNEGKEDPSSGAVFGTLVGPCRARVINKNGIYTVVGPGRWKLWSPRAEFEEEFAIVGDFRHFTSGPITVLRVPNGHYALALKSNVPVVITADDGGLFAINDGTFRFQRFVPIDQPHIQHDTLHILRVPEGRYACVTESDVPAFLPYGIYVFDSPTFNFLRFCSLDEECIKHKTLTRFFVRGGTVGLAWKSSQPAFYDTPGVYMIDNPMFNFVRSEDIERQEITLGLRKIITVREGQVGISHDNGVLVVLQPGRHYIDKPGHVFDEFLSTQQEMLPLQKDGDFEKLELMVCETSELVRIGVQASVFYNIEDPRLAVIKIGERRNIERFINETATAVISTIIRSTSLAEISQGKNEPVKAARMDGDERQDNFEPNMPFFDRVKGDFIERLQANFLDDYGICMLNVRIGDFKVLEKDIASSIAKHALITAETQANLANLEGRRQIDLVNKDSDARIEKITADVEAHKVLTKSKADANVVREAAAAKAEAVTIEARAKAEAIELVAAAEARATELRGEAEAKRAQMIGEVAFGREVTLAEIQAKMMTDSIGGVEKMVYMPTDMMKSPFSLFNAQGMQGMGGMQGAK